MQSHSLDIQCSYNNMNYSAETAQYLTTILLAER